jgi:hypothetical protein
MSILDTFYILFKTDADKAAADIEKVDDASDKAEDGLKKVDRAADGVGASFLNMAKSIAAPLLAMASLGTLLNVAIGRAAGVRELDQFASKLNSSVSDVDAFQRSVTAMGGETAAAVDSLVKLGEKVNEAFADSESAARKDFEAWGLAFRNAKGEALGASDAMLELAGNLESVSRAEALARIKKLGIEDAATIDLLLKGRAALEQRIAAEKELGVVTEDQARKVREYYEALGRAQNALTSIGNKILDFFIPTVTKLVDAFGAVARWVSENSTLVTGFFIGLSAILTGVYLPALVQVAAATIAALWPLLLVGAAIAAVGAAFALAYEDVIAFMDGQPSLIGALAEKYEWFASLIAAIGDSYGWLKDAAVTSIDEISSAWDTSVQVVTTAIAAILDAWESVSGAVAGFIADQREFWAQFAPIWDGVGELISATGDLLAALGARLSEGLAPAFAQMSEWFAGAKASALDLFRAISDGLAPIAGAVSDAANAIKNGFAGAFEFVMAVWDRTMGALGGKISAVADGIKGVASRIRGWADYIRGVEETPNEGGGGGDVSGGMRPPANDNSPAAQVQRAQAMLGAAAASPINGQTVQSIAPPMTNNDVRNTVNVGGVTVNTQATDARGVAAAVDSALSSKLRETASQFDDGVAK